MGQPNPQELLRHQRWLRLARRVYNWSLWGFVAMLQLTQLLGSLTSLQGESHLNVSYGRSPLEGVYTIAGMNDDPIADRSIVCSLKGRVSKPQQLTAALAQATSNRSLVSSASSSVNGYRVLDREGLVLAPHVYTRYVTDCNQIARTVGNLQKICTTLGYNVSATHLRVVVGLEANASLVELPFALPVLILPYWDNSIFAHYAIPGEDGSACIFRLEGEYDNAASSKSALRAVNRTVRETKTAEWLKLAGGTWRHGWYEHGAPVTSRWYSDVISSDPNTPYGLFNRHFDTHTTNETDCFGVLGLEPCMEEPVRQWWGTDLFTVQQSQSFNSVTVSNGKREGLFLFTNAFTRLVGSTYGLETLLSNISMAYLLFRWLVALVALHATGETVGIGVLACARSFQLLPLMLLPRLKTIVAAICTVGVNFEGDQLSLSAAFFVMYLAIAEFVMLLFSVLNLLAKLLRRRASDVLFGPTLLLLSLLHWLRFAIGSSGWFGMDGRVTTVVSTAEFQAARMVDFVSTDLAFRINGEIMSVFAFKVTLLGLQLLPLVVSYTHTSSRTPGQRVATAEKAMSLCVATSGGVGRSPIHFATDLAVIQPVDQTAAKRRPTQPKQVQLTVVPYEIVRAGFLVLGDDVLLSIHDWCWFMFSAPFRLCGVPMDHMLVMVWTLDREDIGDEKSCKLKGDRPLMHRVTDDRLKGIRAWDIQSRGLQ